MTRKSERIKELQGSQSSSVELARTWKMSQGKQEVVHDAFSHQGDKHFGGGAASFGGPISVPLPRSLAAASNQAWREDAKLLLFPLGPSLVALYPDGEVAWVSESSIETGVDVSANSSQEISCSR